MQSVKPVQSLKTISVLAVVAMISTGAAQAQSLHRADEPAEFPPFSFKGAQYVDSRGCVYVRSGSGYASDWVPRVSRDRKVLCGFKPSLTAEQVALPVIPDPEPTQTVELAPSIETQPNSVPVRGGRKLFQRAPLDTVASLTTAPNVPNTPRASVQKTSALKPAPVAAPVVPSPTAVALAAAPAQPQARRATRATFAAAQIVGETCGTNAQGLALRCTPNSTQPVDYILKRLPAGVTVRKASGGTLTTTEPTVVRIAVKAPKVAPRPSVLAPALIAKPAAPVAPTYVAQAQTSVTSCSGLSGNGAAFLQANSRKLTVRCGPQTTHPSAYLRGGQAQVARASAGYLPSVASVVQRLPDGYKRAFDDGRVNPNRGPQTAAGDYQMAQYLTSTVPAYPPNYVYKRTLWQQFFGLPGKYIPAKVAVAAAQAAPTPTPAYATRPTVVLSTKSAPVSTVRSVVASTATKPRAKVAPAGMRYVQVGTFGVVENADKSIASLAAMGFPVSSQKLVRNGRTLKSVLAGPFATPEQTAHALAQARAAGYADAFARK